MDFLNRNNGPNKFVCPNDRQLALRAKLRTGWTSSKSVDPLRPEERAAIISVIQRNEEIEIAERQRVGRLVDRVEKIKERAVSKHGPNCCHLCGDSFGLLLPKRILCGDCKRVVCSKCSVDINIRYYTKAEIKEIWLCRICSETREMWKKSGAWFFKGLPKYDKPSSVDSTPERTNMPVRSIDNVTIRKAQSCTTTPTKHVRAKKLTIKASDSSSSSSDEEAQALSDTKLKPPRSNSCQSSPLQGQESARLNSFSSFRSSIETPSNERKSTNSFHLKPTIKTGSSQQDLDNISSASTAEMQVSLSLPDGNGTMRRGSMSSSWSISDSSSGNSGHVFCNNPPISKDSMLEISISYRESYNTLDCTIVRAKGLPPIDSAGLTDPFCKVNIITPEGHAKYMRWYRTKTVHKTRNPEFNESIQFFGVETEELSNSLLYIVILDDDKYGHDFLGLAKICLTTVLNPNRQRISVPLCAEDFHSKEAVSANNWTHGRILISLCYNTKKRALVVRVKECQNLIPMDNNGSSDPFVKLQLKPDLRKNKKHKTCIKWRTLNPTYNEEFLFEASPYDLKKQSLLVTVWDKDIGKSNDFLGSLVIGHNSKGERLRQWLDCIRIPNQIYEKWHCLSGENPNH